MPVRAIARPDLPHQDADIPELVAIWAQAMADFRSAVTAAGEAGWRLPTPCPGWSVGDVTAHVTSLERFQLHEPDPPHDPDWAALPHVGDDFGRLTEIPVDLRRQRPRDEVLAEFDRTVEARLGALATAPRDPAEPVENPFGRLVPIDVMLRTRIFDTWAHEQDVVLAAGLGPTHLDSSPAWIAAGRMVNGLGYVWAKRVDAPATSTVLLRVTGPGVSFAAYAARLPGERPEDSGKGVLIEPVAAPTTSVTLTWPDYVARSCGRLADGDPGDTVALDGDERLGRAVLAGLAITP